MEEKSLSRPISFAADIDFLLPNPPPRADRQSRNSDSVLVPGIHRICESTDFFSFKDGNTLQDNQYKEKFNIFFNHCILTVKAALLLFIISLG